MKKLMTILAITIAMVCFTQAVNAQTATARFLLSTTVKPFVSAMTPGSINYGSSSHNGDAETVAGTSGWWNAFYANCKFDLTFSGSNAAGQNVPRLARLEQGAHGSGYDIVSTFFELHTLVNGDNSPITPDGNWGIGASQFPYTKSFDEAPHNGQIAMYMNAYINDANHRDNYEQRKTLIDPTYSYLNSADAGVYEGELDVMITAKI